LSILLFKRIFVETTCNDSKLSHVFLGSLGHSSSSCLDKERI